MESEWGGRGRRGGGRGRGGQSRRRGGDRHHRQPADGGEGRARAEAPGRGGSAHRGGRRDHRARGAAPPPQTWQKPEEDLDTQEEQQVPSEYSRRQIASNWDRYKETEKEEPVENGESKRGADYSVLLSSAGDSFTQFRFAEEKEWHGDTAAQKQMSALFVDCQSLAQSLQELPLYLRLNVDAELVQVTIPVELPQFKIKDKQENKSTVSQFRGQAGGAEAPTSKGSEEKIISHPVPDAGASLQSTISVEPIQRSALAREEAADELEEELDMLLSLDAPVRSGYDKGALKVSAHGQQDKDSANMEEKLEVATKEESPAMPELLPSTAAKQEAEEKLEDWLDSMIS